MDVSSRVFILQFNLHDYIFFSLFKLVEVVNLLHILYWTGVISVVIMFILLLQSPQQKSVWIYLLVAYERQCVC